MSIEGFVLLHPCGHYAIYKYRGQRHDLIAGDRLEVDTPLGWITMCVCHGIDGYYLSADKISFYPKKVYARLLTEGESRDEK
jgi:hypothetical protein